MKTFNISELKKLYKPKPNSVGEDNGQITIIGGSKLFHGAPLFALKTASRIVDMVFFGSPDPSIGKIAEQIKKETWKPAPEKKASATDTVTIILESNQQKKASGTSRIY